MDGQGRDDDLTRPTPDRSGEADPTQRIEMAGGQSTPDDSSHADAAAPGALDPDHEPGSDPDGESSKGRTIAIGAVGAVIGFVIAFLVVALGTSSDTDEARVAAAQEEVAELEAAVDERDATIEDLQARLAEAEAAAGARDEDIEQQRDALDERADILDEREAALRERSDALDQRESELDQRQREEPGDAPSPTFDDEDAQNFIDRVVDQIRDLFQGD